jgi:hypothetical protein
VHGLLSALTKRVASVFAFDSETCFSLRVCLEEVSSPEELVITALDPGITGPFSASDRLFSFVLPSDPEACASLPTLGRWTALDAFVLSLELNIFGWGLPISTLEETFVSDGVCCRHGEEADLELIGFVPPLPVESRLLLFFSAELS